ncbi:Zn-ribbon domain-containing OB-fold protein (plasmid) [Rhodococcus erythropolis]|uniref:Zn-ribbon domain-containing OB-fold protein n=1 Tax=Rhodococcus erythropolis TaxID=1833 RepID=UPI00406BB781
METSESSGDVYELERVDAAPGPAQHQHPDVAAFWDSLNGGHLSLQRCEVCRTLRFPIATHCYQCLSGEYTWEPIDPRGVVDVAIRIHEAAAELPASGASLPEPWRSIAPYLTGAVDMNAGVRLPGRIICICGQALTRGTPVRAVLLPTLAGTSVYGFAHSCVEAE